MLLVGAAFDGSGLDFEVVFSFFFFFARGMIDCLSNVDFWTKFLVWMVK